MSLQAVIFDVDGVLVDSYAPHLESWRLLAKEMGVALAERDFAATFGLTSRDIIRQLFAVDEVETVTRLDDRKEALYRDLIREAVPEMPGAAALVEQLHATGLRLAVGSSGPPENVNLVCEKLRIDSRLSARVTGADVTRGKPDPEVFLLAAKAMQIEPRRCAVVEDAPAGVEAANRANMVSIALTSTHAKADLLAADHVVSELSEVGSLIASL